MPHHVIDRRRFLRNVAAFGPTAGLLIPVFGGISIATADASDGPLTDEQMMQIRMCSEMFLSPSQSEEANAALQGLAPAPVLPAGPAHDVVATLGLNGSLTPEEQKESAHIEVERLTALASWGKKWANGAVLNVKFVGGNNFVREKVAFYAKKWHDVVSVRFNFVPDTFAGLAHIRVSFVPGGSHSYMGRDALGIPQNQSTMNFGWFGNSTPDEEFRRTTLHEFGHALGCIHEHQHPLSAIPWNVPAVRQYYLAQMGWPAWKTDQQVIQTADRTICQYGLYDRSSIMHYPIDPLLVTDSSRAVGWNTDISQYDTLFLSYVYSH